MAKLSENIKIRQNLEKEPDREMATSHFVSVLLETIVVGEKSRIMWNLINLLRTLSNPYDLRN